MPIDTSSLYSFICIGFRKEEFILDITRLLIEAGFPNNLLLHECYHDDNENESENVLDTAIRKKRWIIVGYLLSDEKRRHIFMVSYKGDKYRDLYRDVLLENAKQSLSVDERKEMDKLVGLLRERKRVNSIPAHSFHSDRRIVVEYLSSDQHIHVTRKKRQLSRSLLVA